MKGTGASIAQMPSFPVKPEQIRFLKSPLEFFESVKNGVSSAQSRVVISSLYLGARTEKEKSLLDTITSSLEQKKYIDNFRFNILLDAARTMRKSDGTLPKLSNLEKLFPQFKCCLYASPEKRSSLIRTLLPSKFREILGVMHMKFFVFDDTVMITGANLGDSYFSNRMDRYMLIENCPAVASYFESLFYVASALNDPYSAPLNFVDASQITRKANFSVSSCQSATTLTCDTSRLVGLFGDETSLTRNNTTSLPPSSAVLMSAYLNLTDDLTLQLKEVLGDSRLDVFTSSVQAHGFYKAKGLAGIIPSLYEAAKERFLKNRYCRPALQVDESGKEYILEYNRPGWSFHGKGITLLYEDKLFMQFGSSNLGSRSLHRDVENTVTISSKDHQFRESLKEELSRIRGDCERIDVTEIKSLTWYIRLLTSICRRFM